MDYRTILKTISAWLIIGLLAASISGFTEEFNNHANAGNLSQLSGNHSNDLNPEGATCSAKSDLYHSADTNNDCRISLSELLRILQFYNSAAFFCKEGTEDGYSPGTGVHDCNPHDADYKPQNWKVDLCELLRIIQLFNSYAYEAAEGTEDGFQPVPPPFSVEGVYPVGPIEGGEAVSVYVRATWFMSGPVEGTFKIESHGLEQTSSVLPDDSGLYTFSYATPYEANGPLVLELQGVRTDGKMVHQDISDLIIVKSLGPIVTIVNSVLIDDTAIITVHYERADYICLSDYDLDPVGDPDIAFYDVGIFPDSVDPNIRYVHLNNIEGRGVLRVSLRPGSSYDRCGNPDQGAGPSPPVTVDFPRMNTFLTSTSTEFVPGQNTEIIVAFDNNIRYTVNAFGAIIQIPDGWTFVSVSGSNAPVLYPHSGTNGPVYLAWVVPPALPFSFNITLHAPEDFSGASGRLTAQSLYRFAGTEHRSRIGELILSRNP